MPTSKGVSKIVWASFSSKLINMEERDHNKYLQMHHEMCKTIFESKIVSSFLH